MSIVAQSELWMPVVGYEGWYEVSNKGNIKRVAKGPGTKIGKILKNGKNSYGYLRVRLCKEKSRKQFTVHSIVAAAFIGKRPSEYHVNHKDGDKLNNAPDNLEYLTLRQNVLHSYATGLAKQKGEDNTRAKLTWEKVREIRKLRGVLSQPKIAQLYDVCNATVSFIHSGKYWVE